MSSACLSPQIRFALNQCGTHIANSFEIKNVLNNNFTPVKSTYLMQNVRPVISRVFVIFPQEICMIL